MNLYERVLSLPPTNVDAKGVPDIHLPITGLNAVAVNSAKNSSWIDVREFNSCYIRIQYVYGAGTNLTFYLEECPALCDTPFQLVNGVGHADGPDTSQIYALPLDAISVPSTGAAAVTGNITTQVTFPVSGASANFSLLINKLNASFIRMRGIVAGGSPTTSDKVTVNMRLKRFVG